MKISKLTASLLTSTAVFAGVLVAQGQAKDVSASSKLRVDYSSNLRQKAGTDAKIIGGLSVGSTYTYDKTEQASGYTWYEIGDNQWVANAGATSVGGQVKVNYAANKRVGPSTSNKIAGGFYPGQVLTFSDTKQANGYTWYKVGTDAWVASAGVSEYFGSQTATPATAATPTTQTTTATTQAPAATQTTPATSNAAATTATKTTATTPATSATTTQTTTATQTPSTTTTTAAKTTTPAASTATVTAATGRVKTTVSSNLRSGAGTSYGVSGTLPAGTVRSYTATATANGYTWYKVGANAWVAGATPYYGTAATTTTTQAATPAKQSNTSSSYTSQATSNTTASNTTTNTASQATTTTSTGSKTSSDSAGNAYAWGQCTWYVKSVASWAGNHWGNGGQWGASAAAEGFTVNHTPSVGSIVVVAGGQNFGGWTAAAGYGHVAYVVGVSGNSITVQQGGTGFSNPGGPNTQTVSGASNFTYIHR